MTRSHSSPTRPLRLALLLAAALAGGCGGNDQTAAIPAGSQTLGPGDARVEQHYTASLGTSSLTTAIRPHWTFTVDATVDGVAAGVEAPVVRMSVYQDTSTIPTTLDIPLTGGTATGSASVEADSDCAQGQVCSQGFKVRFERRDADPSDLVVSWTGTVHTAVELELGDTSPGDLVVLADE